MDNNISDQNDQKQNEKDLKVKELEESWKRALADYKNLERRFNEEKEAVVAFSNFILLERLIPVLDNLENLCEHLSDQGLALITKQLSDIIKDEGAEEIEALGKDFDPSSMEASEIVEGEDNKVIEVVLKGYKIRDKVIRPARVKVGKAIGS
ncbi:nucleotide exchange factor GrpE [candidate division WWE3 bacterium RIFCSPHIGHO2_01_FULL_40_23]|uniref:Protein GrpE n=1 Tax=candidate division WWE3 bacterium RIFCSPLOWO2_01_FULL_41_18 TaxID=1802625 RepID=A0A1F4VE26_UNCKA|nr:MAG: nucleotide exchange factor GrpE [candidate division WWE3 bacterium RIFCSPHIGHO2_01_FULL_40_23]OGC55228.1 MAG: nucleotide exchange factor GrpE [candidate division WWE3 bacterium RIFCSPLOWO2_01_FULL_41_18]